MFIDTITTDLTAAMRSRDQLKLGALRMAKAALMNREVERGRPLDDAESLQVIASLIKQRRDSIEQFDKAGRTDLATQEREEKAIIEAYLPSQMSADEVRAAAKAAVAAVGAASVKDMGKVMTELKGKYAGKMDFSKANAVVKELLTQ